MVDFDLDAHIDVHGNWKCATSSLGHAYNRIKELAFSLKDKLKGMKFDCKDLCLGKALGLKESKPLRIDSTISFNKDTYFYAEAETSF